MRGGSLDPDVIHEPTITEAFEHFQSENPLYKVVHPWTDLEWCYYQVGPKEMADEPLICLHGTSGSANCFFFQADALSKKGFRVLSVQYPGYETTEDWCVSFHHFFDAVKLRSAHILGAGLGGFLAQHFAQQFPHRVKSLILCNSFVSTELLAEQSAPWTNALMYLSPAPLLRQEILDTFPEGPMEWKVHQAITFIGNHVHNLSHADLYSRLTLNTTASSVRHLAMSQGLITLLESNGETTVPEPLRIQLRRAYPNARLAQLKATGDFPYLSHPDEVTLFVEVHLRHLGIFPLHHQALQERGYLDHSAATSSSSTVNGVGRSSSTSCNNNTSNRTASLGQCEDYFTLASDGLDPEPLPTLSGAGWRDEVPFENRPVKKEVWKNPFEDDLL